MDSKRNQVILNDTQHKALKSLSAEAGVTMSRCIGLLLQLLDERTAAALDRWFDDEGKSFIVKVSRQPALTVFAALHLCEIGHITKQEMKALLAGGESGCELIGRLLDLKTKKDRRSHLEIYDVTRNTFS